MEPAGFVEPACVVSAIPKVGIPRVAAWDRGHPAVGLDLPQGIFAECARDQQSGDREQRDFEEGAHVQDLRRALKRASDNTITPATAKRRQIKVFIGSQSRGKVASAMGELPQQDGEMLRNHHMQSF